MLVKILDETSFGVDKNFKPEECIDIEPEIAFQIGVNYKFDLENKTVVPIEHTEEEILYKLRERRQEECFSIVNRGEVWYNTLTEEQLQELQTWYQAWLDVTETKEIPEKPSWLK
jgi:hypothetical protein